MAYVDPSQKKRSKPRVVAVRQSADQNARSLALNIAAMVLVIVGFLLHNWPGS